MADALPRLCFLTTHDKHLSFGLERINLNQKSDEHLKRLISNNKTIQKNIQDVTLYFGNELKLIIPDL